MSFQPTLSDSEDQELERMVNQARITTTAQFYIEDKKEGLTEIGLVKQSPAKRKGLERKEEGQTEIEPAKEPPAKKTRIMVSNIRQWSKKSLKHHVKKIEENLTLIQQGREDEAEVFVGNNTRQRDGLNMVSGMLQEHIQKIANKLLERTPSQATELLGTKLVNPERKADQEDMEEEPAAN